MKGVRVEEIPDLDRRRFRIAVVGPENAGKSTLVNALLGRDVADVSPTPGTTKSVSRFRWKDRGLDVTVLDTFGVAGADGRRSKRGVKAEDLVEALGRYDLALYVVDATKPLGPEALRALHVIKYSADLETVLVANKMDLVPPDERDEVLNRIRERTGHRPVPVSALTGEGLGRLVSELERRIKRKTRALPRA
ncbi:MAG: GTP-binding protein [Methanopyri archaeon]|nr:GTP-binding protein [Methanopyri archaeon]